MQISNAEGTPGTAEAATEIVTGATYTAAYGDKVIHKPEEDRNDLSMNLANDFIVGEQAQVSIEGRLNSRIFAYLFSNSINGNLTPYQQDAGNDPLQYSWDFVPQSQTANTPDIAAGIDTFTIELGDNVQGYEIEYCVAETITLTGTGNEPVEYTWEMFGRQVAKTTFTPALSVVEPQFFVSNLVKFYIGSTYANIFDTQKTDTLLSWTLTLATGFSPRYPADGILQFGGVNEAKKMISLELEYLRGTNSEAEKDKYDARATTYLGLELLGATEIDSGRSNPPRIRIQMAARYFEWPEADDNEGAQTVTVTAETVKDATASKQFQIDTRTEFAAFP